MGEGGVHQGMVIALKSPQCESALSDASNDHASMGQLQFAFIRGEEPYQQQGLGAEYWCELAREGSAPRSGNRVCTSDTEQLALV
jgi:hypothetical protein